MIAVSDAGPLIVLGRTGHLHVLEALFARVVVPEAVWAEVMADDGTRPGATEVQGAAWLERHPDLATVARGALGAGEAQAIALAARLGADRVLLDDLAGGSPARAHAARHAGAPRGGAPTAHRARPVHGPGGCSACRVARL